MLPCLMTKFPQARLGNEGHGGRLQGGVQAPTSAPLQRKKRLLTDHIQLIDLRTFLKALKLVRQMGRLNSLRCYPLFIADIRARRSSFELRMAFRRSI